MSEMYFIQYPIHDQFKHYKRAVSEILINYFNVNNYFNPIPQSIETNVFNSINSLSL